MEEYCLYSEFTASKGISCDYANNEGDTQVGGEGDAQHQQGYEEVFALPEVLDHEGELQAGKDQQDT